MKNLLLLLLLVQGAMASVLQKEALLSKQLTDVYRSFDSRGVVQVMVTLKDKKLSLPGTNFLVDSNVLEAEELKDVKSLKVNIFTELDQMPEDFKNYVEQAVASFNVTPEYSLVKIVAVADTQKEVSNTLQDMNTNIQGWAKLLWIFALIPLAIFGVAFLMKQQIKKSGESLSSKIESLAGNLGGGSSQAQLSVKDESSRQDSGSTVFEKSMWEHMPVEYFNALLSDCYWSHKDNYAAFIWSKVPVAIKKELLDSDELDSNYLEYVSNLTPIYNSYGESSYYLKPLEFSLISNEDIGKLVKADKRVYKYLSPIRVESLELSLEDKLECARLPSAEGSLEEELIKKKIVSTPPSEKRVLERRVTFEFASFEEESELLKMKLSLEEKRSFPSLGWGFEIPTEKLVEIMQSFPAKDLATGLFTNEKTKEKLVSVLSDKRRELVRSYLQNTVAQKNAVYYSLMEQIYAHFPKQESKSEKKVKKVA